MSAPVRALATIALLTAAPASAETLVVRAETLYTMGTAGTISDGAVVIRDGKVAAVGKAGSFPIPPGAREIRGKVAAPGLIDAHTVLGLSGLFNDQADQDASEKTGPVQPDLRAQDGFNPEEGLLRFALEHGTTTVLTGPGSANLVGGQAAIYKTDAALGDAMLVKAGAAMIYHLGESSKATYAEKRKAPTTRMAEAALIRKSFQEAMTYEAKKKANAAKREKERKPLETDAAAEAVLKVLHGEMPAMITANRESDIDTALRLVREFKLTAWLAGAADGYLARERIKASGLPVLVGPVMERPGALEMKNVSLENAALLVAAGVPVAFQTGEEGYVPKSRAILWDAAIAAANGLGAERTLRALTADAAKILGIADRVGSLSPGKDGDVLVTDADPFEYRTHVTAVLCGGRVSFERR